MSARQLQFIAAVTRRMPVRGTGRILRRLHSPANRDSAVDAIVAVGDGLRIHASTRSDIEWQLFFYGGARFEPGLRRAFRRFVTPGAFVVDVGANVGLHTLAMAKLAYPGRVAAFEPSPRVRERLEMNLQLNAVSNVDVLMTAVGDRDGVVSLHIPAEDADMSPYASLRPNDRYLSRSIPLNVPATRLDTFVTLNAIPHVSLIKIDVEGLEPEVLVGAEGVLIRDKPVLIFEYDEEWWGRAGHPLVEVMARLSALGYDRLSEITSRGTQPIGAPAPKFMNVLALCGRAE